MPYRARRFRRRLTPFGHKFGCDPARRPRGLLNLATQLGYGPRACCFHVGSQQLEPARRGSSESVCAVPIFDAIDGPHDDSTVGGGFPIPYAHGAPELEDVADADSRPPLTRHFRHQSTAARRGAGTGGRRFRRATIRCEVVSVRARPTDGRRWVYLDIGRYGGLAETGERVHPIPAADRPRRRPGLTMPSSPGRTCDGDDVLYQGYPLPVTLRPRRWCPVRGRRRGTTGELRVDSVSMDLHPCQRISRTGPTPGPGRRRSSSRWHRG